MIGIYRKLPVEIRAFQWKGDTPVSRGQLATLCEVTKEDGGKCTRDFYISEGELYIESLEGTIKAKIGDYVVRGTANELYPVDADIFGTIYEYVGEMQT